MKKLGLLIGFICLSGVVFAAPQAQEHFSLFPNPVTQGEVSVTSEKPINKVEVLSIVGVVLFEETVETINEVELTRITSYNVCYTKLLRSRMQL